MASIRKLLRENLFRPEGVPAFEQKLFFEGERRRPYLERFSVLLVLTSRPWASLATQQRPSSVR